MICFWDARSNAHAFSYIHPKIMYIPTYRNMYVLTYVIQTVIKTPFSKQPGHAVNAYEREGRESNLIDVKDLLACLLCM